MLKKIFLALLCAFVAACNNLSSDKETISTQGELPVHIPIQLDAPNFTTQTNVIIPKKIDHYSAYLLFKTTPNQQQNEDDPLSLYLNSFNHKINRENPRFNLQDTNIKIHLTVKNIDENKVILDETMDFYQIVDDPNSEKIENRHKTPVLVSYSSGKALIYVRSLPFDKAGNYQISFKNLGNSVAYKPYSTELRISETHERKY